MFFDYTTIVLLLTLIILINIYCYQKEITLNIFFKKLINKIFHKKNIIGFPSVFLNKNYNSIPVTKGLVLLNIPVSDQFGQAVHPDVKYIKNGFGRKKYKYWMTCTSYPYESSLHENPEMFVSNDGFYWTKPKKSLSQIVKKPKNTNSHYSDPIIVFTNKKLLTFYRKTEYKNNFFYDYLYQKKMLNNLNWSKAKLLIKSKNSFLLSPTIEKINNKWCMWTINQNNKSNFFIEVRNSKNLTNWSKPYLCEIKGLKKNNDPWHLDVKKFNNITIGLLTTINSKSKNNINNNWFIQSFNNGLSFKVIKKIKKNYEFESLRQYRGCILKIEKEWADIYYSACNNHKVHYIARTKIKWQK